MEHWKPVIGYEGLYEVSDMGRVRTIQRMAVDKNGRVLRIPFRIRVFQINSQTKYPCLRLKRYMVDYKCRTIHSLVAEAFLGERPEGMQVAHNDGNPSNNKLENLRYATRTDNQADRIRHGTHNRGERQGCSRLMASDVRLIRQMIKDGVRQRRIAEKFGMTDSHISAINTKKAWRHLD